MPVGIARVLSASELAYNTPTSYAFQRWLPGNKPV
jgi:hypothetical protein